MKVSVVKDQPVARVLFVILFFESAEEAGWACAHAQRTLIEHDEHGMLGFDAFTELDDALDTIRHVCREKSRLSVGIKICDGVATAVQNEKDIIQAAQGSDEKSS